VERISRLGWHYLQLDPIARVSAIGQGGSNPVAAMPSLHAGAALLVSGFLWPVVHRRWRAVLAVYVVLMALALVYTGEHYVVDVVAGWATAGVGLAVGAAAQRLRRTGPPPDPVRSGAPGVPALSPVVRSEESPA
jgi:membrane-associated phospholipid phosphatase